MIIINAMLLGACLIYGLIIAALFNNGNNFNNIWIWTTFIIFVMNHRFIQYRIHQAENEDI